MAIDNSDSIASNDRTEPGEHKNNHDNQNINNDNGNDNNGNDNNDNTDDNNDNNDTNKNKNKNASHRPNRLKRMHGEIRLNLPVHAHKSEICRLVSQNEVVLVSAETGSGKSTQIPAFLHEGGLNKVTTQFGRTICVTQPRRVAAITVATRVAEEMGCKIGTVVGYRVRFDDNTDTDRPGSTRIMYVTDGMLLREAMSDPLLTRYSIIVLDEAHERSLQTDILFGVVTRAMRARNAHQSDNFNCHLEKPGDDEDDKNRIILNAMKKRAARLGLQRLRAVVMSATLEIDKFQSFFPKSVIVRIPGRQYPVQMLYTKEPQEDYIEAALSTVLQIHKDANDDGDILVFLPGQEDIEDMASLLKSNLDQSTTLATTLSGTPKIDIVQSLRGMGKDVDSSNQNYITNGVLVCVLYAALPPDVQMLAFQPRPQGCRRKVILSTNIAETSVTLDGICYVVDTGKYKMRSYSGATGMESLTVADISKAQAAQRSGRAGRVASGTCFRLYPEVAFNELENTTPPEILRVNLSHVVLQLKGMGVADPRTFDFLTPPDPSSLLKAFEQLYALGAIDAQLDMTQHGKRMAKFPLDPTFAHLLLQSPQYGCVSEMLSAVAMLSAENVFYRPGNAGEGGKDTKASIAHRRFASHEGDLPTLLSVYQAWRKEAVYVSSSAGGKKAQKRMLSKYRQADAPGKNKKIRKMLHGDWCVRNYISGRSLVRALDVRNQLEQICRRDLSKNGLGWDVTLSCGAELENFLRCACAGLFLQSASRIVSAEGDDKKRKRNDKGSYGPLGRYKTKVGGKDVSVHPTSSMFGRNPAPKCVVYTELLVTKRTYIRGVTQVREEWLAEVAPQFFK